MVLGRSLMSLQFIFAFVGSLKKNFFLLELIPSVLRCVHESLLEGMPVLIEIRLKINY